MSRRSTVRRAAVSLGLVLALTLTGCGGDAETAPGVTDSEIRLGTTLPLSGPMAGAGTAVLGGLTAYFNAVNGAGGVTLKDGVTRRVRLIHYDDGDGPDRAVANYRRLVDQDKVFALVQTFGTVTNRAVMAHANRDRVPQLFVHSGASEFSADRKRNEWTVGWQPQYQTEGFWHARHLTAKQKKFRVAVLSQDDEIGKAFLEGFEHAIEDSKVEIVDSRVYQPGVSTLSKPVARLAKSKADVFYSVVGAPELQVQVLRKVRELGWKPTVVLTSLNSSIRHVVRPSGVTDGLRATGFIKDPDDPQWANDPDMRDYLARMRKYSPKVDPTIPNAEWGYSAAATFVKALEGMSHVSRDDLLESVYELAGEAPLLLPGVKLDGVSPELPAVQGVWMQEFRAGEWFLVEPDDWG